jgi:hypothetical protein
MEMCQTRLFSTGLGSYKNTIEKNTEVHAGKIINNY